MEFVFVLCKEDKLEFLLMSFLPLAKKLPESLISESESSLVFHKISENLDVFGFGAKFVLLRLMRNSEIPLSCSASDVLPAPRNDIFEVFTCHLHFSIGREKNGTKFKPKRNSMHGSALFLQTRTQLKRFFRCDTPFIAEHAFLDSFELDAPLMDLFDETVCKIIFFIGVGLPIVSSSLWL